MQHIRNLNLSASHLSAWRLQTRYWATLNTVCLAEDEMYSRVKHLAVGAAIIFLSGCLSVPSRPPYIGMFPSLHAAGTLNEVKPYKIDATRVQELLRTAGIDVSLGEFRLKEDDFRLLARGLSRHGYAEIDARRSASQVRWAVLKSLPETEKENAILSVETGYWQRPPEKHLAGINLDRPPDRTENRTNIHGEREKHSSWERRIGGISILVSRVTDQRTSRLHHWEIIRYYSQKNLPEP